MARLSILIPVLGNLKRLEDTLVSVLENRPAGCQIVVALNQPYDDPYDLKGEVTFVQTARGAGWAECVNEALEVAEAPVIHLLTSGVEVSPAWTDFALPHFDSPEVAAVVPWVLDRTVPERIISAGLAYSPGGTLRRLGAGRPTGQFTVRHDMVCGADTLAAFYRKSALEHVGRLARDLGDAAAGADLAMALRHAGFHCVSEPECRAYADTSLLAERSAARQGMEAERLFWRWAAAGGWVRSLVGHVGLLSMECAMCPVRPATVCKLAGRVWGSLSLASHRRHWRSLQRETPPVTQRVGPPHFSPSECRKPVELPS